MYSNLEFLVYAKLASRFNCGGIPTLIFVDSATGEVVTTNGRGLVTSGKSLPATLAPAVKSKTPASQVCEIP